MCLDSPPRPQTAWRGRFPEGTCSWQYWSNRIWCTWFGELANFGEAKQTVPYCRICDNLDVVYVLSKKFTLSFSVNFQGLIGEISNFF